MTLPFVNLYKVRAGIRFVGFLCALFCICSCAQLELDDEKPQTSESTSPADTGEGVGSENSPVDLSSVLTIAEVQQATNVGEEVTVRGYCVGFVDGTTLDDDHLMLLSIPTKANTNLLLADSPYDRGAEMLFPVELRTADGVRDSLNFYDHPELLKQCIAIRGTLSTYFRVNGLKGVTAWRLLDNEDDDSGADADTDQDADTDEEADDSGKEDKDDTENTDTTGGGAGDKVERWVFPKFVESRSADRAS